APATGPARAWYAGASANSSPLSLLFLLLLLVVGEHRFEQGGADVFQAPDGLFHRSLVVEDESALDVAQLLRHLSHIDLDILEVLLRLRGSITRFLGVGNDVGDRGGGLLNLAILVERVGIAKLTPCDLHAEFGTVFETRAFQACFQFGYGGVLGGAVAGPECKDKHIQGKLAHGSQRFFGSMAIR